MRPALLVGHARRGHRGRVGHERGGGFGREWLGGQPPGGRSARAVSSGFGHAQRKVVKRIRSANMD